MPIQPISDSASLPTTLKVTYNTPASSNVEKEEGMSNGTKAAIGIGIAAIVALAAYALTKRPKASPKVPPKPVPPKTPISSGLEMTTDNASRLAGGTGSEVIATTEKVAPEIQLLKEQAVETQFLKKLANDNTIVSFDGRNPFTGVAKSVTENGEEQFTLYREGKVIFTYINGKIDITHSSEGIDFRKRIDFSNILHGYGGATPGLNFRITPNNANTCIEHIRSIGTLEELQAACQYYEGKSLTDFTGTIKFEQRFIEQLKRKYILHLQEYLPH